MIEVKAPYGGAFHPKVWVLRFTSPEEEAALYRFVCLSRNLTFDSSWDTVLALEGKVANRKNGFAATRPLADFLQTRPSLAIRPDQAALFAAKIEQVIGEVRRVVFEAPPGFYGEIEFDPNGIKGYRRMRPVAPASRRLIVSPFLTETSSARLRRKAAGIQRRSESFVLNLPVTGMPEERNQRLIQHLISDRSRFLRYLPFLLSEGDPEGRRTGCRD